MKGPSEESEFTIAGDGEKPAGYGWMKRENL